MYQILIADANGASIKKHKRAKIVTCLSPYLVGESHSTIYARMPSKNIENSEF